MSVLGDLGYVVLATGGSSETPASIIAECVFQFLVIFFANLINMWVLYLSGCNKVRMWIKGRSKRLLNFV